LKREAKQIQNRRVVMQQAGRTTVDGNETIAAPTRINEFHRLTALPVAPLLKM
jgi:hypothetical protein